MVSDDGVAPNMSAATRADAVDFAGSLHVSDAAGTTPPSELRSMFQTISVAMRSITPTSWGQTRDAVSRITGASY